MFRLLNQFLHGMSENYCSCALNLLKKTRLQVLLIRNQPFNITMVCVFLDAQLFTPQVYGVFLRRGLFSGILLVLIRIVNKYVMQSDIPVSMEELK